MIRGVECTIQSSYETPLVLPKLLEGIDICGFDWVVDCVDELGVLDTLPEGRYDADAFLSRIRANGDYLFIRIRRYPAGAEAESMIVYEDFVGSPCSFVVICVDRYYFTIYAKDHREQAIVYENCLAIPHEEIDHITDDNDGRTGLIVP